MAVDTRDKRASCLSFAMPTRLQGPLPTGALATAANRAQLAYSYPGLTIAPPALPGIRDVWRERTRGLVWEEALRQLRWCEAARDLSWCEQRPLPDDWREKTRPLMWTERRMPPADWLEPTRPLVWSSVMPTVLVERVGETAPYAYDYKDDALIGSGDTIVSVTSVVATGLNAIGLATPLTVGTPTVTGTRVIVPLTGSVEGAAYEMTFTVVTAAGWVRVGLGYLDVRNE